VKEIILFDIDYMMLDTAVSKEVRRNDLSGLIGVPIEVIMETDSGYVKKERGFTDYNPHEYITHVSNVFNFPKGKIRDVYFSDESFKKALYEDVIPCLEKVKETYECGIFSEGFEDFQMIKLHKSQILKYFKKDLTFIFRRKLTEEALSKIPEKSFILDDNPEVISALVKYGKFRPIWVNRKTKEEHSECKTIFGLTNLIEELKNYSIK
jgi:hypothetical protein